MNRYSPIFNIYTLSVYITQVHRLHPIRSLLRLPRLNAIVFIAADSTVLHVIINRVLLFLDTLPQRYFGRAQLLETKYSKRFEHFFGNKVYFVIFIFGERIRLIRLEIFCGRKSENFNFNLSRNLLKVKPICTNDNVRSEFL